MVEGVGYTKELIAQAYHTLNTTTNPQERKHCDQLLTEFQVFKKLKQ